MCLDTVDETPKLPDKDEHGRMWAWKVVKLLPQLGLVAMFHDLRRTGRFRVGWQTATKGLVEVSLPSRKRHATGFHCFARRADAEAWCRTCSFAMIAVVRVQIADARVTGTYESFPCIVARRMRIPREECNRVVAARRES